VGRFDFRGETAAGTHHPSFNSIRLIAFIRMFTARPFGVSRAIKWVFGTARFVSEQIAIREESNTDYAEW
jgi:hypothetical protein